MLLQFCLTFVLIFQNELSLLYTFSVPPLRNCLFFPSVACKLVLISTKKTMRGTYFGSFMYDDKKKTKSLSDMSDCWRKSDIQQSMFWRSSQFLDESRYWNCDSSSFFLLTWGHHKQVNATRNGGVSFDIPKFFVSSGYRRVSVAGECTDWFSLSSLFVPHQLLGKKKNHGKLKLLHWCLLTHKQSYKRCSQICCLHLSLHKYYSCDSHDLGRCRM